MLYFQIFNFGFSNKFGNLFRAFVQICFSCAQSFKLFTFVKSSALRFRLILQARRPIYVIRTDFPIILAVHFQWCCRLRQNFDKTYLWAIQGIERRQKKLDIYICCKFGWLSSPGKLSHIRLPFILVLFVLPREQVNLCRAGLENRGII